MLLLMRAFLTFWRSATVNAAKTIYWWIGLVFTIIGLIPLFPSTWYGDWGRWFFLGVGLFTILLWSPFKVWQQTEKERVEFKCQIDSKEANVEMTDFDHELEYKKMTRNEKPVIVFRTQGILRNKSPQNSGSLDFLRLEIETPRGFYLAKSDIPTLGHTFEPNSIYPRSLFVFVGDLSDPSLNIQSWEPFIKGGKGKVVLNVQGQKIKTYPIKIADKEGF